MTTVQIWWANLGHELLKLEIVMTFNQD
jgi:hypothetical protein